MDHEDIEVLSKDNYIKDDIFISQIEKFEYEENSTEQIFIYGMKDKKANRAVIPYGVTCIERHAFADMESLGFVDIPETMEEIYDDAFAGCKSLISIRIPKSVTFIAPGAFRGCDKLFEIEVDEENEFYTSVNGVLFSKEMDEIVQFPPGYDEEDEYVIPDTVSIIRESAFEGCGKIGRIILPDGLRTISKRAFQNCGGIMGDYELKSVTDMGDNAFCGCVNLQSITLSKDLRKIPQNAFSNCSKLSVVTMHQAIESVDKFAFAYCEELSKIIFCGDKKHYSRIKIADGNTYFEDARIKFK